MAQPASKRQRLDGFRLLESANIQTLAPDGLLAAIPEVPLLEWYRIEAEAFGIGLVKQPEFAELQFILLQAQFLDPRRLLDNRKLPELARGLAQEYGNKLHILMGDVAETDNTELLDAIQYYLACVVNISALKCAMNNNTKGFETMFTKIRGSSDELSNVSYFQMLVEGAARYQNRKLAKDNGKVLPPPRSPTKRLPSPSRQARVNLAVEPSADDTLDQQVPEPYSNAFGSYQAEKMWVDLDQVGHIPIWSSVKLVSPRLVNSLDEEFNSRRLGFDFLDAHSRTPKGTLLHGTQGVGKSALVYSFCRNYGIKLLEIGSELRQPIMGQSDKILQAIYDQVIEITREGPCAILFDEVDGILNKEMSSGPHNVSTLLTVQKLKSLWGKLISHGIELYVFGTTNSPQRLDMRELARRLPQRVHIRLPDIMTRAELWKLAFQELQIKHTLLSSAGQNDFLTVASESEGFTPFEIRDCASSLLKTLALRVSSAVWWTRGKNHNGSACLIAVSERTHTSMYAEPRTASSLDAAERKNVSYEPIGLPFVLEHLRNGDGGMPFRPANPLDAEKFHEEMSW